MSTFWLKIIAITAMVIDHTGAVIFPEYPVLRMIGRLTFPIFAFLIAEGAYHTKDLNKYIGRMLVFALLSEIPFDFAFNRVIIYEQHQNVMWTFLLALLAIWVDRKITEKVASRIPFVLAGLMAASMAYVLKSDYQAVGVLVVLVFYALRDNEALKYLVAAGLMLSFGSQYTWLRFQMWREYYTQMGNSDLIWQQPENWLMPGDYIQGLACLAFPLTVCFNGKKGISLKYFFYVFYPVHLLVIGLIAYIM